jgi:hypothetical protein
MTRDKEKSERARPVAAEDFVRIWQTSKDLDEVVERTGLRRSSASQRATILRTRRDIPLKEMPRVVSKIDYEGLKTLAGKLRDGDKPPN